MWLLPGHIKRYSVFLFFFGSNLYPSEHLRPTTLTIVQNKMNALKKKNGHLKLLQEVAAVFKPLDSDNAHTHAEELLKKLQAPERGGMSSDRREALIAMYLRQHNINPYPRNGTPTAALMAITQPFFEF